MKDRKKKPAPERIEVSVEEISAIVERTQTGALSAEEHAKLKAAIDTFALITAQLQTKDASIERLRHMIFGAMTESTRNVLGENRSEPPPADSTDEPPASRAKPPGHGRNAAAAYTGAEQVTVRHPDLHGGEACPGCTSGKLYPQSEPAKLVRITGMAPLSASVYACDRLRCNLCGEVYTAPAPAGVGNEKYDATATSMVGLLKYGAGLPFNRIEKLQDGMGIPLPAEMLRGAFRRICAIRKNVPCRFQVFERAPIPPDLTAHFFRRFWPGLILFWRSGHVRSNFPIALSHCAPFKGALRERALALPEASSRKWLCM